MGLRSRTEIIDFLVRNIREWSFVLACWEGGAVANNRLDSYSDVDLLFLFEDGFEKTFFEQFATLLSELETILFSWNVTGGLNKPYSQSCYKIARTAEFFFLDIVAIPISSPQKFMEKDRHGNALIHFDKNQLLSPVETETPEFIEARNGRLKMIEESLPFYEMIVSKQLKRSFFLDALAYYRVILSLHSDLIGMLHRPARFDFGLRYADLELPKNVVAELEYFNFPSGNKDIALKAPELIERVKSLTKELRAGQGVVLAAHPTNFNPDTNVLDSVRFICKKNSF